MRKSLIAFTENKKEVFSLEENGDIYINEKLETDDKVIVESLRNQALNPDSGLNNCVKAIRGFDRIKETINNKIN